MENGTDKQVKFDDEQEVRQTLQEYPRYAYERDRLERNDSERSIDVSPAKHAEREEAYLDRGIAKKKSKFGGMSTEVLPDNKLEDGPHCDDQQVEKPSDPDADGVPMQEMDTPKKTSTSEPVDMKVKDNGTNQVPAPVRKSSETEHGNKVEPKKSSFAGDKPSDADPKRGGCCCKNFYPKNFSRGMRAFLI